jgi:hypothetical protein
MVLMLIRRILKFAKNYTQYLCSDAFQELAYILKPHLQMPSNAIKVYELYEALLDAYEELNVDNSYHTLIH